MGFLKDYLFLPMDSKNSNQKYQQNVETCLYKQSTLLYKRNGILTPKFVKTYTYSKDLFHFINSLLIDGHRSYTNSTERSLPSPDFGSFSHRHATTRTRKSTWVRAIRCAVRCAALLKLHPCPQGAAFSFRIWSRIPHDL